MIDLEKMLREPFSYVYCVESACGGTELTIKCPGDPRIVFETLRLYKGKQMEAIVAELREARERLKAGCATPPTTRGHPMSDSNELPLNANIGDWQAKDREQQLIDELGRACIEAGLLTVADVERAAILGHNKIMTTKKKVPR